MVWGTVILESGAASWRKGHSAEASELRGAGGRDKRRRPGQRTSQGQGRGVRGCQPPAPPAPAQPLYLATRHLRGLTLISFGLKKGKKEKPTICFPPGAGEI